jgi:transcription termination factor Rho
MMDSVIFEEFKGTGNAELKLDRKIADKRVFPAIDIESSGTRNEQALFTPAEQAVVTKLRRALLPLGASNAIEQLLDHLRRAPSNAEFLATIARTTR